MKWTLVPIPRAVRNSIVAARSRATRGEIQADRVEVPCVDVVMVPGRPAARQDRGGPLPRTRTRYSAGDPLAPGSHLLGALELHEADRRREVRQVVLEAHILDLVIPAAAGHVALPGITADAVQPHHPSAVRDRVVVGHEHPALAGRDRLGGVEAERAGRPPGAGRATDRGCTEGHGRHPRRRRARGAQPAPGSGPCPP